MSSAKVWEHVEGRRRSARWSSPRPTRCCSAPARTSRRSRRWTRPGGRSCWSDVPRAAARAWSARRRVTIAAVNALAFGGGCELAMALRRADRRAVGELRPARDQPRDHPGLRRHPAPAAARRREQGAGDEPHRRCRSPPRRPSSSAWSTASCPTTSCSTPRWPGRASSQVRRRWRSQRIKEVSGAGDLDEGIEAEKAGLRRGLRVRGRREGISAFLAKRKATWQGR